MEVRIKAVFALLSALSEAINNLRSVNPEIGDQFLQDLCTDLRQFSKTEPDLDRGDQQDIENLIGCVSRGVDLNAWGRDPGAGPVH